MTPPGRIFSEAFNERGINNVLKIECYPLKTEEIIVNFESASSERRQGICLKSDGGIWVDGKLCPSVYLWYGTAALATICRCISSDSRLFLYNVWERDGITVSLSYSAGMLVEDLPNGRRYRCNDAGFETKFDGLVFRIEQRD